MKKIIFIIFLSLNLFWSCSNNLKEPIGPSIKDKSSYYGQYDIIKSEWIADYDGIEKISTNLSPSTILKDKSSNSIISAVETNEGSDKFIRYYYESHENPEPDGSVYSSVYYQWGSGVINIMDYGNAVAFRARGKPVGSAPMGKFYVVLYHPIRNDDDYDRLRYEIALGTEWKEYIVFINDFEFSGWGNDDRDYSLENNIGVAFSPEPDVVGLKGIIDIDDVRFVLYIVKR